MRLPRRSLIIALALGAASCGTPQEGRLDGPTPESLVGEARRLDLDGKQAEAIAVYRRALELEPGSYNAHYGIARALDLDGSYEEARQHFTKAIELAPENARDQPLRMLGIAWTFVGDIEQASRYFRQVFDRRVAAGNIPDAADVANELGRVYLEAGDTDRAEEWYRNGHATASRASDRPRAQIDLAEMRWAHAQARIAARRGQAQQARQHEAEVRRLLDKGGNADQEIQYAYLLGYDAFHRADHAAAVTHLKDAAQDDPFILLLLAQSSERLGDAEAAREYYRQVLASNSHAVNAAFARPVARRQLDALR